jgi:hypothetical protein
MQDDPPVRDWRGIVIGPVRSQEEGKRLLLSARQASGVRIILEALEDALPLLEGCALQPVASAALGAFARLEAAASSDPQSLRG